MLHLVMDSPFQTRALEQCLAYRAEDDGIVLLQDGVIAACTAASAARLAGLTLYVLQEDVLARGLTTQIGTMITMADLVDLIAETGSPQRWAG